jgi:predicted phage terminase large subunit-like protein
MPIAHVYPGNVFIPEVVHTSAMIDTSAPLCADALKRHAFDYVRIETNNQGGGFIRELRRLVPPHKVFGAKTTANKHTRIVLSYGFVMRYCVFLDERDIIPGSPYDEFLNQVCSYLLVKGESKDHDDGPDALAGLAEFIQGYLPRLYGPEPTLETADTKKQLNGQDH